MTVISLPRPNEQRKVEILLAKLAKIKPISTKLTPIVLGKSAIVAACTANSRVFFST